MSDLVKRLCRPGYDLQKEQAIQEAIIEIRELRQKLSLFEQLQGGLKMTVDIDIVIGLLEGVPKC